MFTCMYMLIYWVDANKMGQLGQTERAAITSAISDHLVFSSHCVFNTKKKIFDLKYFIIYMGDYIKEEGQRRRRAVRFAKSFDAFFS